MLAMLRSPDAPGRAFALHTCDEDASPALNYLQAPWHVSGMVTLKGKLGVYSNWQGSTVRIDPDGQEFEYYDYATEDGRLELANTASSAAAVAARRAMAEQLTTKELRAPLPGKYRDASDLSRFLPLNGPWLLRLLLNALDDSRFATSLASQVFIHALLLGCVLAGRNAYRARYHGPMSRGPLLSTFLTVFLFAGAFAGAFTGVARAQEIGRAHV